MQKNDEHFIANLIAAVVTDVKNNMNILDAQLTKTEKGYAALEKKYPEEYKLFKEQKKLGTFGQW
jgi:hypothetical protein